MCSQEKEKEEDGSRADQQLFDFIFYGLLYVCKTGKKVHTVALHPDILEISLIMSHAIFLNSAASQSLLIWHLHVSHLYEKDHTCISV